MVSVMDYATPNLPSRDCEATSQFFASLGFQEGWRDGGWMILTRGGIQLEFFPHPELDPATSWFSCCLRLDDLDEFYAACLAANVPEAREGAPRLHSPALRFVDIHLKAIRAAAKLMKAAKLSSVLSYRVAIRRFCLRSQKKFSTRCRQR